MLRKVAQQVGDALWVPPGVDAGTGTGTGAGTDADEKPAETETETDNVEGPRRERWGPSTSCPVRHWRRIRDSNS
jgi:hypothetical protein